ncbi:hypothetical protein D3872_04790 [Massilia cavernae]|uniref:Uncharacterized protein n=1 Tax=Massilia cavernae TaxID=2320864 RepID=A0A418Y685_9BURK|nr:hypothetical protein D3872_04790 [Massilia cavernae]
MEARLALGKLYLETGDVVAAEKELSKAQSLGAPPGRVQMPLLKALSTQGQFDKVLKETEGASDVALMTMRANALMATNKQKEAAEIFGKVLSVQPDNAEALIGTARQAAIANDMDAAARLTAQAVEKSPRSADAWMFKGDMARSQGKLEEAEAAYARAIEAEPAHRSAQLELATLQIARKKFDAAKASLAAAAKNNANSMQLVYTQALLAYEQKDFAGVRENVQKITRVAPDHLPSVLLAGRPISILLPTSRLNWR